MMKVYIVPQTQIEHLCSMNILIASAPAQTNIPIHTGDQLYGGEY